MLAAALPKLTEDIRSCVESAAKGAAYSSVVQMFGSTPTDETDAIAERFSNDFSKKFSLKVAPELAQAIMNFVMQGTVTGSPVGLACAVGPVTGAITPETLKLI